MDSNNVLMRALHFFGMEVQSVSLCLCVDKDCKKFHTTDVECLFAPPITLYREDSENENRK